VARAAHEHLGALGGFGGAQQPRHPHRARAHVHAQARVRCRVERVRPANRTICGGGGRIPLPAQRAPVDSWGYIVG
jgi:hypothetical protein